MRISDSEQIILEILWRNPPLTAAQVVKIAQETQPWSDKTIKTFLTRLRDKGAIRAEKHDVYYFSPIIAQGQAELSAARTLVKQKFGGSLTTLVAGFVQNGELTKEELAELRDYLTSLEKEEEACSK